MEPNKIISLTAGAAGVAVAAGAQRQQKSDAVYTPLDTTDKESIYGPLKVIKIPHQPLLPATFKNYPNIDPDVRKGINNGGLDSTCSTCNDTGCLCPDLTHHNISFGDLCENSRGTFGGGSLNQGCNDHPEQCNGTFPVYFCEPQRWDQDPALKDLNTPTAVYDFAKETIMPPGLGGTDMTTAVVPQLAQQTQQAQPPQQPQESENSGASQDAAIGSAAWLATAVAAAWVYGW
ncbi:MAG: hypothetical protein Q9170_007075 [Blastenia crenularia]